MVVVLVVLGAERLEHEVVRDQTEWRLKVVRDEGHPDIVARVTRYGRNSDASEVQRWRPPPYQRSWNV